VKDSSSERRGSIGFALLFALSACTETRALPLPSDEASTIVLLAASEGALEATVIDPRAPETFVSAREGDRLYALIYAAPPDALFLSPGRLELVEPDPAARVLAPADRYLEAGDRPRQWTEIVRPDIVDRVALRAVDDRDCHARDGWLRLDEDASCGGGVPLGDVRRCVFSPKVSPAAVPDPDTVAAIADMTPCPEGWDLEETERAKSCTPAPRLSCAPGTMQRTGERACSTIGAPCVSKWPDAVGVVLYVESGAAGDGSRDDPLGSIAEAIAAAPSGAMIAVAAGVYREPLVIDRSVSIAGACTEAVIVTATVAIDAVNVVLRDLRVGGVAIDGSAELDGVWIEGSGIETRGPLVARDVLIAGAPAAAIVASAAVDLERVVIDGAQELGLAMRGGQLRFHDLRIEDIRGDATAIDLSGGATVRGDVLSISRSGLGVRFSGASGEIELAFVETSTASADRRAEAGSALAIVGGSSAIARRWLAEESATAGVLVFSSTATISDVIVRRAGLDHSSGGYGVTTYLGEVTATRLAISDVIGEAVHLGCSRKVTVADLYLGGVTTAPVSGNDNDGRGIHVYTCTQTSTFGLQHALIENTSAQGLLIEDYAAPLATQSIVRDVVIRSTGVQGISAYGGGALTLEHARIESTAATGIRISAGGHADLTDVTVRGTSSYPGDDFSVAGHGIAISEATATITRFELANNKAAGLYFFCPVLDTCEVIDDAGSRFNDGRIFENRGAGLHLANVPLRPGERTCDVLYRNNAQPFSK
jgi:hypothetical protein